MPHTLKPLSRQTIVITGASSGIGLATARKAARRGARPILVSRSENVLARLAADLRAEGLRADHVAADVGDRAQVAQVVDTVIARHGGFDTWVNGAGCGLYARLTETPDADHERLFRTNYWGVVHGSTEALRHLGPRGGALINIGSIASDMPTPVLSAYAASKHAVKGFTDSLRLELLHDGVPVSVTLIKPSGIHTPFGDHARNFLPGRSKVPPPVYHPDLVADAILRAAERPLRDVTVGEAGLAQTAFARWAPGLADRLFPAIFFGTALDTDREKRSNPKGLHEPGSDGEVLGEQRDHPLRFSPLTTAQLHPALTLAAGGVLVAALAAARRR